MTDVATLDKWLRGPHLKVDRAKKHLVELGIEFNRFLSKNPYRIVVEPNTGEHAANFPLSLTVRISEGIPEDFSAIIGDVVHNLRSALDLLACAIVRAEGNDDKRIQYPVAWDADSLDGAIQKDLKGRAPAWFENFVRNSKPYDGEGGNWAICLIHKLDIQDKHRLIIAVGNVVAQFGYAVVGLRNGSLTGSTPGALWPLEHNGAKLIDIPAVEGLKVGYEVPATFAITFGPGPGKGRPVIDSLKRCADYIGVHVNSIKAVARP